MLYYLLDFLNSQGNYDTLYNLFGYISVRSALAIIMSLVITIYFGQKIINILKQKLVKDKIRDLGLIGQNEKQGTPTMGGIIILIGVLLPTLLFCQLNNIYVLIMILTSLWLGAIGFIDDYIKVFKKNKKGLAGRFKILGQISLGIIVSCLLYSHPDIVIQEKIYDTRSISSPSFNEAEKISFSKSEKTLQTTIPFFKNNQLNYQDLLIAPFKTDLGIFIVFSLIIIFIITAVSNSANLTDGIDGLTTGLSAIIGATLGVFCYVSGNMIFANYLDIMYIPDISELVVFMAAFVGSCVGFLWYNSFPAQVFMGDTGSLSLGGIIGVVAILVRKELLLPIFCGIFFLESLSVIIQVSYFKYTKQKLGAGKRIFLMSPLHHHYQKQGIHESKIVTRFWILCVFFCLLAFVTLKLR